jgi:hypothetical protein
MILANALVLTLLLSMFPGFLPSPVSAANSQNPSSPVPWGLSTHDVARYLGLQSPVPPKELGLDTNPFDAQLSLTLNPPDLEASALSTCDPNNPQDEPVGTISSFFVFDFVLNTYVIKQSILAYKTPHSYIYIELEHFDQTNTQEGTPGVVSLNQAKNAGDAFENTIYHVERQFIGEEPNPLNSVETHDHAGLGSDFNDADCDFHVTLLNVQITAPPLILATGGIVAGYFTSADEYPTSTFTFSNQREMVYLNVLFLEVGAFDYNGVVAHELQHMINWNTDPDEDTWVNEGMSDLAIEITGYSGGTADSHIDAFEALPDTQLNAWGGANAGELLAHYGAAFAWVSYFLNHYGPTPCTSDFTLARALSNELANGFEGFDNVLTSRGPASGYYAGKRSNDIFRDWAVANFLDDPSLDNCQFGYTSLDIQIAFDASHSSTATTATGRLSADRNTNVHQFGTDAIHLFSGATPLNLASLTFDGTDQVKVVPNDPTSPTHERYSNRGDALRNTLTRRFDLAGYTGSIVLEYNIWYNTEDGWDYGYVKTSANNALSFTTQITPLMTNTNPHNNNDGFGYTGMSGFEAFRCGDSTCHNEALRAAGFSPQWIMNERVDLSSFAGQNILVRFELETDQALNYDGISIDDVSLLVNNVEVYSDNVETGPRDWVSVGWILTDTFLEQDFSLRLVKFTPSGPTVSDVNLNDSTETASALIEVNDAVLFVSGITQPTTVAAGYHYTADGPPGVAPPRQYKLTSEVLIKEFTPEACVIGGPRVGFNRDQIYWRRNDCGRWFWTISPPDTGKRFTTMIVHEGGTTEATITPGSSLPAGEYSASFTTFRATLWPSGIYTIHTTINSPDLGNEVTKQFFLNWLQTTVDTLDPDGFSRSSFVAGDTVVVAGSVNEINTEFATPVARDTLTPVPAMVNVQLVDDGGNVLATQNTQAQLIINENGVNSRYEAEFTSFNPGSWTNPISVRVTATHIDAFGDWTGRASTSFTLSVPRITTSLMYTGQTTAQYSDAATLSARLTDNSEFAVSGQEIRFTIGSQTTFAQTDATGTAAQSMVIRQQSQTAQVVAEYAGSNDFTPSTASSAFTINHEDSTLAYHGPTEGTRGETITLRADLGEPDSSLGDRSAKTITFTLGTQTATGTTDQDGVAMASMTLAQSAGQYPLRAEFAGDQFYTASSTETIFTIFETATGAEVEGKGRIPVPGGEAKFLIDVDSDPDHNQGNVHYLDNIRGVNMHSLQITGVIFSGNTAIIEGTAKVNSQPGYTFSIRVEDNGPSGDRLFITIYNSSGNTFYNEGGTLTKGDITVRIS